jgi:hypothetical protein
MGQRVVMQAQAIGHVHPPEARKGKRWYFRALEPSEGVRPQ